MLRKKKKELEDSKKAMDRERSESSHGQAISAMSEEDVSQHTVGNDDEPSMNENKIDYESELKQLQALTRNEDKSESRVGKKLSEST